MEEYIDIVDERCTPTGEKALKSEIHKHGYLHNTVHIWFYTPDGDILLQQRSHKKLICPLLWDVSVAGHVGAGETIEGAAVRETKEEIGLEITPNDLRRIGTFYHEGVYANGAIKDNEFHHVFISELTVPVKELTPNPLEVEALKTVDIITYMELVRNTGINMHFIESNNLYYQFVGMEIHNQILDL